LAISIATPAQAVARIGAMRSPVLSSPYLTSSRKLAGLIGLLPLLAACITTGDDRLGHRSTSWNRARTVLAVDELPTQVSDVAVLGVLDATGAGGAPLAYLRGSLAAELPSRLYSPLAADWVDGRWSEASSSTEPSAVPPGLQADALLQLELLHWSTEAGRTRAEGIARLLDGENGVDVLWELEIAREISSPVGASAEERGQSTAEQFAAAIVAELPSRDPVGELEASEGAALAPEPTAGD